MLSHDSDFVVSLQPDDVGRTQARGPTRAAGRVLPESGRALRGRMLSHGWPVDRWQRCAACLPRPVTLVQGTRSRQARLLSCHQPSLSRLQHVQGGVRAGARVGARHA